MWRIALALGLGLALFAPHALAQSAAVSTRANAEIVARGLEAQYQAALIRERRLADERELALIAQSQAQLHAARAAYDQGLAGASAALDEARAQYAALVQEIALRDAASRAEIEAYRAEAQGLAAASSPERLAALERFGDGDRVGAWPLLEALRLAQDRAIETASNARRAVRWRQDAELREIMRINGEATAADVLALWDEAARLDPYDFNTHLYRARLARALNSLERAQGAVDAMGRAASHDGDRRLAAEEAGTLALARNDLGEAERQYRVALETTRRLAHEDPRFERETIVYLLQVGNVLRARNELGGALALYSEALEIARGLHAAEPEGAMRAQDLSASLDKVAEILFARDDLEGARSHYNEALQLRRHLFEADPTNAQRARNMMISLGYVGDVLVARNDLDGALANYREGLVIARRLLEADPANALHARDVSVTLTKIGDVHRARNDLAGARAYYAEGLEMRATLFDADRSNADHARDVSVSLEALAHIPGSGVSWADVVAFMEEMDARGQVTPADRPFLEEFRRRAAAAPRGE